ncbi:MAG: non-homologous end-joining DNA ligase [Dehalococcoidia bacterium]|nr:non-homologous end-joining DNA ligase [Dehalococcoidia bacterium]
MPRKRTTSVSAEPTTDAAPPSTPAPDALEALARYEAMRDFGKTPEPAPVQTDGLEGQLTFVVQKHRATRMHYDVRLEFGGTMKSWPIPRGPSIDPSEKRLAVMTEDHPLDYAWFEGIIPRGQYGAGEVIVWDNGTYSPDEGGHLSFHDRAEAERRMFEGLAAGKISVTFRGRKLKGSWTLIKTAQDPKSWLAIKHRDDYADPTHDLIAEHRSVICGLSIEDLQAGHLPDRSTPRAPLRPHELTGARAASLPRAFEPMQAANSEGPFSHPDWIFEPKLDGIRAVVTIDRSEEPPRVSMRSRRGNEIAHQYPALAAALARQPVANAVFDGEIVAFDQNGRPSFEALQQRMGLTDPTQVREADANNPVVFYAFDLPHLDGYDLTRAPTWMRKELLARVLLTSARVQYLDHFERDGESAYRGAEALGLEGVVAKKRDTAYEPGRRSRSWLKVKIRPTEDFVVGGYTAGNGGRGGSFGALVVGQYDEEGRLIPAGRVGSGFNERTLADLLAQLKPLERASMPFAEEPSSKSPYARNGDAPVTWVEPELVVEVEYAEWTADGNLRAPVFKRLRPDRRAADITRAQSETVTVPSRPVAVASSAAPAARPEPAPQPSDAGLAASVASVLEQLDNSQQRLTLEVDGYEIPVTNLDKVMWPAVEAGRDGRVSAQRALTKRDLLVYLARTAHLLLPHLRDRPLTLTRFPNGLEGGSFYQKHYEQAPPFVHEFLVWADKRDQDFIVCNNLATLLWTGQIANLALHTSLARINPAPDALDRPAFFSGSRETVEASVLNYPDFVLFDLDPYIYAGHEAEGAEPELNRTAYQRTCEVALWLKEMLDGASLSSFVKTSGATGLHVYVPIVRNLDYGAVRGIAETLGGFLVKAHPQQVTMEWQTKNRAGKVFFDANQNARIKNMAAAYSPRAKPGAPVSVPVRWNELFEVYPTELTILTAPARFEERGDLWAPILESKHDLRAALGLPS